MGHTPLNIYMDRPNLYLGQLSELNIRLFIIGQYKGAISSPFRRISTITPDVKPHFIISQTKLENFATLHSIAGDYGATFIHYENYFPPQKLSPKAIKDLKSARADVNVFTDPYLMEHWEFFEDESVIIENSIDHHEMIYKPYHVSNILPLSHMINGIIPVVLKTPYTKSIITQGLNGFFYSDERELSGIINKLTKMDKEDLRTIGENSRKLAKEQFPKDKFLESWKNLLRSLI